MESRPCPTLLTIACAGVIVLAAAAAYHNSFSGSFVYDDLRSIPENRTIRRLWPLWQPLSPPSEGQTVGGRPLLNLSLAINYALGELNVWSYHAVNLAIHVAAALVLFGILRRTFLMPVLSNRLGSAATLLALASALLWLAHPLQTESVTYIVQRAESLAGLFYVLTLYCVIRGAGTVPFFAVRGTALPADAAGENEDGRPSPRDQGSRFYIWYFLAVLACLLGMATKEVMVTAPLLIILFDRTFLAGSFREALRRRWGLYAALAATWSLLAYLVLSTGLVFRQSAVVAADSWSYARSQPGVILHYLGLAVWPNRLCISYEWPVAKTLGEIVPQTMAIGLVLMATVWGLARRKAWAFLGTWFFLILAPTSSILPLNQLAHEHRMYLPLVAVSVLAVVGGYVLWETFFRPAAGSNYRAAAVHWAAPALACAAVLLALQRATVARNCDYRSSVAIWQDTVNKRPSNPLAHNNLGAALNDTGKINEAIQHYQQALHLKPDYSDAQNNLGLALAGLGRTDEAIEHYQQALRWKPDDPILHNNLGAALDDMGKINEAIEHCYQALRLKPDYADAQNNLGHALAALGRSSEAITRYQEALLLDPNHAKAHNNLGASLALAGRWSEAIKQYQNALRLKPDYAEAHNNLGIALASVGKTAEAIEHLSRALQLQPDRAELHVNLGNLLVTLARNEEAIEHFKQAISLAQSTGQTALANKIQERLELYRAGRAYRESQN